LSAQDKKNKSDVKTSNTLNFEIILLFYQIMDKTLFFKL
jgi:hypothetical protein